MIGAGKQRAEVEGGVAGDIVDAVTGSLHGEDHLRLLPPSANWYCSKICDWGRSDVYGLLLAFGAKNSVFIYQVTTETESGDGAAAVKLSYFAQLVRGKRDRRVTAVQFLTDTTGEVRIIFGGEEGSVQIWDVASLTMIEQHRKHKAEVTAVTVSATLDANFVVAGDRQGRISAWGRDAGKVSVFMPISGDSIHSMALSPHDKSLVAVGYRSGVLCLVDAVQGIVRHRLAGHDQEVQCVAWKSTANSIHSNEDTSNVVDIAGREVWLASSSRDKTIKVWKIISSDEPALDQVLRLPTGKQGMSFTQTKQLWLPVAWSLNDTDNRNTHCLWSGSFDGSLFRWEWSAAATADAPEKKGKQRRASCKPVVVKGGHSRMLFSIVPVPRTHSSGATNDAVSMLTVSLDREVRLWRENASSKASAAATCVETLTGLGGHAYSVVYNATTGLVAAGVGDQTIRLWKVETRAASGPSDYECDLLWKGLQSKVTCVRWHPLQHFVLAYGMEDGRIGLYDIQTKKYKHFRTSHDREVQQLEWIIVKPTSNDQVDSGDSAFLESIKQLEAAQTEGQSLEDALIAQDQTGRNQDAQDVKVLLWSCDAGGDLLELNADAVDQKCRHVMSHCVAFDWNEQCELVAVGRSNGIVEVMERNGIDDSNTVRQRFHEHVESITCLAWSKGSNATLLASGGQDGKVFVYNCGKTSENAAILPSSSEVMKETHRVDSIGGHTNKITGLSWCSDVTQKLLASSSADGTVQVWNMISLQREAFFNHHVGRVLSFTWVSPYTLVTGGEDQTLRLWDYRKQQKDIPSKLKKHSKVKQPQEVETIVTSPHTSTQTRHGQVDVFDELKTKTTVSFHPETKLTSTEIATACCRVAGVGSAVDKREEANAITPVHSLLIHSDRASLRDFLAFESKRFQEEREWESLAHTLLLQGHIIEALRIVATEGALTPTWLAYAPMAGMEIWREMTNLYAHQVDSQGDKKAAAFHFLSIGKVRSAVGCLVRCDAYQEALALIRSRLGPTDPLLHEALGKYSDFLTQRGRHGEAALALMKIGSVPAKTRAVHMLVNTDDAVYVKAALDVLLASVMETTRTDHNEDHDELAFPASFFLSIAGKALKNCQFDVAEAAGQLLDSRLVGGSASHGLTWCLLSILKALDDHQLNRCKLDDIKNEAVTTQVDNLLLLAHAPASICEFFEFLTNLRESDEEIVHLYDCVAGSSIRNNFCQSHKRWMADRADRFWFQVLSACRRCGYWFDADGERRVQEAQDLLVDASCFREFEKALAVCAEEARDHAMLSSLRVAQKLLRLAIDVMSSTFLGALEHMREAFLLLAQSDNWSGTNTTSTTIERVSDVPVDLMTLLFPCGFASLNELPQCGELAEEQGDTLVLWSSVLLSQCKIAIGALTFAAKSNTEDEKLEANIRSFLHLLEVRFLDDTAISPLNRGLRDADNQSQLEELMNDVLVAVHQLPDKHANQNTERPANEAEEVRQILSTKQALIIDVKDVRSRLTWSDDGVKK